MDNILGRNILPERKVEIYHTELDEFKAELERHNFHKCLTNLVDSSIDLVLGKEFYANLYSSEDPSPKQVRVRDHLVRIDANSCRNLPFGRRARRDSRVHLPRKEYARSRHQRLFEENIGKTGKDVVYEL